MYSLDDFDQQYFSPDDFIFYNKDGEGCKVNFPVYMNCHLHWCAKALYDTKYRDYTETLAIFLVKSRVTKSISIV